MAPAGSVRRSPIRVLIADDHALVREGLVGILRAQPGIEVAGEASDGVEAVATTRQIAPDIVLMDVSMPGMDGLEATRVLTQGPHEWRIVMLTASADKAELLEAMKAGASGYLLKSMRAEELATALRALGDGEMPIAPALSAHIVDELRRLSGRAAPAGNPVLTKREQDVLAAVARGAGDKQVARELSVSIYTVKAHMRNILAKLQVDGRYEAARYARREGLLP